MDLSTLDEFAERWRQDVVIDRACRVPQGEGSFFFLTDNTLSICLLVPSALLAWMTFRAVATSASRANAAMWSSRVGCPAWAALIFSSLYMAPIG